MKLSVGPLLPLLGSKPAAAATSLSDGVEEHVAACPGDATVVEGVSFAVVIVIAFAAFAIGVILMSSLWFIYVKTSEFNCRFHSLLLFTVTDSGAAPLSGGRGVGLATRWMQVQLPDTMPWSRWRGGAMGRALDFPISRSQVQILLEAKLRNNLGQVVHTYVPLSPSSITWYRPKGGDAVRLGR